MFTVTTNLIIRIIVEVGVCCVIVYGVVCACMGSQLYEIINTLMYGYRW